MLNELGLTSASLVLIISLIRTKWLWVITKVIIFIKCIQLFKEIYLLLRLVVMYR